MNEKVINQNEDTPKFMSIRTIAATGLLPEHALRIMHKRGELPCVMVGNKALVNYTALVERLRNL